MKLLWHDFELAAFWLFGTLFVGVAIVEMYKPWFAILYLFTAVFMYLIAASMIRGRYER